jgi:ABC-type multidrug transport system ATPase subunit
VLLTTHYMFEADALCDRIAVIAKGEIVAEGTPRELKSRVADGSVVEIEVYGVPSETRRARARVEGVARRVEERDQAQLLVVQTDAGAELTHRPARPPRRRERRPRLVARADARGRVRRARRERDMRIAPAPGLGWLRT